MARQKQQNKTFMAQKASKYFDVNVNDIVISELINPKTNSKYLIEYLDKVIWLLNLVFPKMSRYIKTFKVKDRDKDKNNKLISFCIDLKSFGLWMKT